MSRCESSITRTRNLNLILRKVVAKKFLAMVLPFCSESPIHGPLGLHVICHVSCWFADQALVASWRAVCCKEKGEKVKGGVV